MSRPQPQPAGEVLIVHKLAPATNADLILYKLRTPLISSNSKFLCPASCSPKPAGDQPADEALLVARLHQPACSTSYKQCTPLTPSERPCS